MAKTLVVCIDGTGDWVGKHQTNVARIFHSIVNKRYAYYDGGVGTLADMTQGNALKRKWIQIKDLATATSMQRNVCEAYRFIVRNYEPGDHIVFFGFSRGAFACRLVGSLIHSFGILRPEHENLIPYLWQAVNNIKDIDEYKASSEKIKEFFSAACGEQPIDYMGLFDTVSSVGIFDRFRVYPYTDYIPSVKAIRHAMSIHESRNAFMEAPLDPAKDKNGKLIQDLKEVWFEGVHRDVGGGASADPKFGCDTETATLQFVLGGIPVLNGVPLGDTGTLAVVPSELRSEWGGDVYVMAGLYSMSILDYSLRPRRRKSGERLIAYSGFFGPVYRLLEWVPFLRKSLPKETYYRTFWPNLKHFRPIPKGAFVWRDDKIEQVDPTTPSAHPDPVEFSADYFQTGNRPFVGDSKPVADPVVTDRTAYDPIPAPHVKGIKRGLKLLGDGVGVITGVCLGFLWLRGGLPLPKEITEKLHLPEVWTGTNLFGLRVQVWIWILFGLFLLYNAFTQVLDRSLLGRRMNAVALALWFFVVLAVIWQVPDKTNFLIGCGLGVPIIACSLFFSRKWGIIRADRAVAALVVPWLWIIFGAWLLRTILSPGAAWVCNALFKNYEFWPFEGHKINQGAWIVTAFGYLSAIHSILTDRSMKKQQPPPPRATGEAFSAATPPEDTASPAVPAMSTVAQEPVKVKPSARDREDPPEEERVCDGG